MIAVGQGMHTKGATRDIWLNNPKRLKGPSDNCVMVRSAEGSDVLMAIKFQDGPVDAVGVNGVCMLDIIDAMKDRLGQFQAKWPRKENVRAIMALDDAAEWLKKKRDSRKRERGNAGTGVSTK